MNPAVSDPNILCCTEAEKMQNERMRTIDLVQHQTTILPGLEEAIHHLIGKLNEARKLIDRAPLILIEDQNEVNRLYRERKTRREKLARKVSVHQNKQEQAEQARIRIEQRDQQKRLNSRNVKTLVKRRRAS